MLASSRRGFLQGRSSAPPPLRPPWAGPDSEFTARCTRCGDCQPACPEHILASGPGGYPTVDFSRGECTFCGACATACQPAALRRTGSAPPWSIKAGVGAPCLPRQGVECRVCGDYCDARAIRFPPRPGLPAQPEVDAVACTGCGACVAPCPTHAIELR